MSTLVTRSVIGLFQGIVLSCLIYSSSQTPLLWPATNVYLFVPLFILMIFIPLLVVQSIGNMSNKFLLSWATLVTLVVGSGAYYAVFRQAAPIKNLDEAFAFVMPEFTFCTFGVLFIAQSLVLSSIHDKRFKAQYPTYFDIAWKLGVQVIFAIAFISSFWLLLFIGMGLFEIIHLHFFTTIITNQWFAVSATALACAIALHVTDVNVNRVRSIRTLILVLLSWLLPIMTGIIGLFLVSLFYTGPELLWKTGYGNELLLFAAVMLIILVNAVYQDGEHTLSLIQRYAVTLACCLLTPIIILVMYALSLQIRESGLSVDRIYAFAGAIIVAAYALGYALAVFIPNKKLKFIETTNYLTSWLIIIIYFALFTPIADPARLMVANQVSRLQSGQVAPEKFDFKVLRFGGLRFGQQALEKMQTTWQGPQADYVRAQAKAALALTLNRMGYENKRNAGEGNTITVHTKEGKLPDDFLKQSWSYFEGNISIPHCLINDSDLCDAWIVKDKNQLPLILILSENGFTGFQQNEKKIWVAIGSWIIPGKCKEAIRNAKSGKFTFTTVQPSQPDIEIMGWRATFLQKIDANNCK